MAESRKRMRATDQNLDLLLPRYSSVLLRKAQYCQGSAQITMTDGLWQMTDGSLMALSNRCQYQSCNHIDGWPMQ
jgi:hypothetical protein